MGGSFFQDTEGALLPGKPSVFEQGNYSSKFPLQCSLPGRVKPDGHFERMTKNSTHSD